MIYLLDTHLLLWGLARPELLPPRVRELIDADGGQAFASAAAIWEIAIKHARNRGRSDDMPITGQQALTLSEAAHIPLLEIRSEHAAAVDQLPLIHSDPFDRIMVVQAQCEAMVLLTTDRQLVAYGDHVMLV